MTVLAMTSGAAFAEGGHAPQPLQPATVYADTYDWSGAYAGLGLSMHAGDMVFGALAQPLEDVTAATLFAGYALQSGNFVYGA